MASDYGPIFDAAGAEWDIDPRVLRAVAQQESGGNPNAVSKAGARGVMQIMPGTAQDLGVTDLADPQQSIFGGAKYLSQLFDRYKSPGLALAAYNAGPQRVDDYLAGKGHLPAETAAYVPAVASHYQELSKPLVLGDSIADGIRTAAGLPGVTKVGAKPSDVLQSITSLPADQVRGRDVVLSGGASNDPAQAAVIGQQIAALKAKGAANVTLLGVGTRPDFAGVNDHLASVANQTGATFAPLDPTNLAPDGVHPANYKALAPSVAPASGTLPTLTVAANGPAMPDDQVKELLLGSPTTPPPSNGPSEDDIRRTLLGDAADASGAQAGKIDPLTGQPFQFANTSDNNPVAQSLDKTISEDRKPGVVTQAIAGLPTDAEQRRRIVASQLFPQMSPTEAQSHVFYGTNGRLAAVDPNGNPFYVDPEAPSISGRTVGNPLRYAASLAGGMLPAAGGIAGALAAGPGSTIVGPAGAAAGAAAGDLARQYLARSFDPSATPPPIDLSQTGREAALSGAAQFGGALLTNALAPNALRVSPGEVNVLRSGPVMPDTRAAYARANAQGVDLTPGQASGLPSLLQYEDAATSMPGTVDQAAGFYRNQGNQLATAGQNMLSTISPNADKTDAALMFRQGAEDATRAVRQQANAAARPAYQAAEAAGNIMSPDLAQLADVPAVQSAMDRASKTYQNLYGTKPPETPDFALWDLTKRQLDDAYTVAQRAGERTDAMALDNIRQRLIGQLDTAYPTYETARATAAPGQRLASQLEDSGVGSTASSGIDERARAIVAPVFNQNPRAIAQARDAFTQAGRSDEWYAGVRSYIQDAFDKASQSQQGLNPSMLRRQVWGNVDNRDAIRAALTPPQYQGFDNFMRTVEDVARTYPMNSLTATRLNARGALAGAGESQGNVRALDAIATAFSPVRLANIGTQALSGVRQRVVQGNVSRIVGRLFSPDGLQYLEAMSAYSPTSQRAIEATAQIAARTLPSLLSSGVASPTALQPANPLQPAQ